MGLDTADRGSQRRYPPPHPVFEASVQTVMFGGGMDMGTGGLQVPFQGPPSEVLSKRLRWWVGFLVLVDGGGRNDLPEV